MRNPGEVYKACHAVYCIDNVKMLCSSVCVMSCLHVAAYGFRIYVRNDVAGFVSACGRLRVLSKSMCLYFSQSIHVRTHTSFLVAACGWLEYCLSLCVCTLPSSSTFTATRHSAFNAESRKNMMIVCWREMVYN